MTTTVTKTIRSSGGDYTTLSAWEAAQQGDLVAADEIRVAECYDDWASGLDDAVTVSGSTTDSTRFMKITVASGHRHNGTPQSGFFMESSAYNQAMIILTDQYSVAEYVDVKNTKNLALTRAIELSGANTALRQAIACASNRTAIYNSSTSTGKVFESCLAYSSTTGYDMSGASTTAVNASNCAAANCTTGFFNSSVANDKAVINCVAYGCTTSYTASAFDHASSTNNAASDGSSVTPPGSNPITTDIVSGDFSNAASNNFHLSGTGSTLYHAGSNTTSATHDIDGEAFHATTPSIGFDEYASSSTYTVTATASLVAQKQMSAVATAGAAVQKTLSASSSGSPAIQKAVQNVLTAGSAIQKAATLSASGDAAIQETLTLLTTASAALKQSLSLTATGSAYIITSGGTAVAASASIAIKKAIVATALASAAIKRNYNRSAAGGPAVKKTASVNATSSAAILKAYALTLSAGIAIAKTQTISASANPAVKKNGLLLSAAASAYISLSGFPYVSVSPDANRVSLSPDANRVSITQIN